MRTLPSRLRALALVITAAAASVPALAAMAPAAGAQTGCGADGCVDVVAVEGVIDEIEADFIVESVGAAEAAGDVVGVVLQLDSPGSAVGRTRLGEVAAAIEASAVPVSVWIGASGAEALGGAAELTQVAAASGISPGSGIGDVGSQRLSEARFGRLFAGDAVVALDRVLEGEEAADVMRLLREDSERAYSHYEEMLNHREDGSVIDPSRQGLARELARMNLSLNYYTQWYWKVDLHNLLHFLSLRADSHAQYEIRVYAEAMLDVVKRWVPAVYESFTEYRMGGAHLSRTGLDVVKRLLAGEPVTQEASGLSKREWRELMDQLGRSES